MYLHLILYDNFNKYNCQLGPWKTDPYVRGRHSLALYLNNEITFLPVKLKWSLRFLQHA